MAASHRRNPAGFTHLVARLLGLAEEPPSRRGARRGQAVRKVRGKARRGEPRALGRGLIGLDVGHGRPRLGARRLVPVLALALLVALAVASLRTEMLRLRYALAEASLEENRLLETQRSLTAEKLRLRDPVYLASRAQELGFARPERLIDLPSTAPPSDAPVDTVLASVAAPAPTALDQR
jgi:hypothetical protein